MGLTRRQLLAGGVVAGAAASGGLYTMVDQLAAKPTRLTVSGLPVEQHVLLGQRVITDNRVAVVVPPLHHEVVTARLRAHGAVKELKGAQAELEYLLTSLERQFEPSPAGIGVTVAWGLPYFRRLVPHLAAREIPIDRRASKSLRRPVKVLLDARRFPSDPGDTVLEANDVAILLRSDSLQRIGVAHDALFRSSDLFDVQSIRRGFVGGGFAGGQSLPKRIAVAAGVPGADLIPDSAELFLGFTSTQKAGLGPPKIANLEELGFAEGGYFAGGTHLALSHIAEDLEAWYVNFAHAERVSTTFRPGLHVPPRTLTVPQGPDDVADARSVERDFRRVGQIGHSSSLQTASRLATTAVGRSGAIYGPGTAIPHRADFNTLDNPFAWSADPQRDGMAAGPAAGVHFVVFNPSTDDFNRTRLAMDGVLPDGTRLPFEPRDRGQGFNSILRTTHRQNFLVPPRRHRSFPLVELLV
jgi:hypothetical protein